MAAETGKLLLIKLTFYKYIISNLLLFSPDFKPLTSFLLIPI